ncbi:MAG: hypothetical protein ABIG37_03345 [Nanoarchaeota archaeon]|nr:hypothetical protein [Nanoarchaeota archaeon]
MRNKNLIGGLVFCLSLIGCGGRAYIGSYPLGSDLSRGQKEEIMKRENEIEEGRIDTREQEGTITLFRYRK